jgi:hypothetical protein
MLAFDKDRLRGIYRGEGREGEEGDRAERKAGAKRPNLPFFSHFLDW